MKKILNEVGAACLAGVALLAVGQAAMSAQERGGAAAPDPTRPHRLEVTEGSKARYRVREQLAGISFPSDAVGTTEAITGAITVNPDGSFAPGSKITVDLRTLTSDQPRRAVGLPSPLPARGQAGFQLVADVTLHGVTSEVTWNVVAVLTDTTVDGRATAAVDFAMFDMTKPSLARLLSVDDTINLEIEFRCARTVPAAPG